MRYFLKLLGCSALLASNLAISQTAPMVGLSVEFTAEHGTGGIYIQGFVPFMNCTVQSRLGANPPSMQPPNLGRHDIYMGVWRPDGSWATFTGDNTRVLDLNPGFTPIIRGLEVTASPVRLAEVIGSWGRPFEYSDPAGIYWGFCIALREGEMIDDLRNVRNLVMTPFLWQGYYPNSQN